VLPILPKQNVWVIITIIRVARERIFGVIAMWIFIAPPPKNGVPDAVVQLKLSHMTAIRFIPLAVEAKNGPVLHWLAAVGMVAIPTGPDFSSIVEKGYKSK